MARGGGNGAREKNEKKKKGQKKVNGKEKKGKEKGEKIENRGEMLKMHFFPREQNYHFRENLERKGP